MPHGLLPMLNLPFDVILEFIENGLSVKNLTNKLIREAKRSYYEKLGNKLSDPKTGQKNFWTAFKRTTNKKKQTNIPPIFDNDMFVTNFQL